MEYLFKDIYHLFFVVRTTTVIEKNMKTLLHNKKLRKKLRLERDYLSFDCSSCGETGVVFKSMKDSVLTCSFCGKQIIEFKLKASVEHEAKIKKVISEKINLKLLSSVKDLLQTDKLEVEPSPSFYSFNGIWDTKYGLIELKGTGNRVEGSYPLNAGRIRGLVKDKTLTGKWSQKPTYSEPEDAGDVEFRLTKSGKSFNGRWKYGSSGDWKYDWQGKLIFDNF
jgi:ribosomal protein S27E